MHMNHQSQEKDTTVKPKANSQTNNFNIKVTH